MYNENPFAIATENNDNPFDIEKKSSSKNEPVFELQKYPEQSIPNDDDFHLIEPKKAKSFAPIIIILVLVVIGGSFVFIKTNNI